MIALYARVSTQEQASEGYSIEEQVSRLKAFSAGFPSELYVDAGYSGATSDRPELQRLIRDVRNGKVNKVIVYKLDRLSRSQKDTLHLIEDIFLANGCDFVSMSENFDTSSPFGRAMIGVLAVFAQLEREQIKERMSLGKEGRAKAGKWRGGGKQPVGYNYTDKLVIDPFEAMQVREAFERYARGETAGEIARSFEEKGYRHKSGAWDRRRILYIISNPLYVGDIPYKGQIYRGEHEPIVSRELFDRVQEVRSLKEYHGGKNTRKVGNHSTYLGGMIFCAHCGARYTYMQTRHRGIFYRYYVCTNRRIRHSCQNRTWAVNDLDEIIFAEIKKLAVDPSYLERIQPDEKPDRSAILRAELSKLDEKQNRLIDLYSVKGIDLTNLEQRISDLASQRERLQAELEAAENRAVTIASAVQSATSFSSILEHGTFAEIRLTIETLIRRIEIDGEDVTIFWSFL